MDLRNVNALALDLSSAVTCARKYARKCAIKTGTFDSAKQIYRGTFEDLAHLIAHLNALNPLIAHSKALKPLIAHSKALNPL